MADSLAIPRAKVTRQASCYPFDMAQIQFADFREQCRRLQSSHPDLAKRQIAVTEADFGREWILADADTGAQFTVYSADATTSTPAEAVRGFALMLT